MFDLFTLQQSKSFLISIGKSWRNIKPKAHSQNFNEARLWEQSRVEVKQKAGKHDFKQWNGFHVVETWDKQLSKMEEVLIMELVVRHLGFSINKSFQAGK